MRRVLDPRPADVATAAPFADAVNIPFDELPSRTYELPPREVVLRVAGPGDLVGQVVGWLEAHGRAGVVTPDVPLADPASTPAVGRLWRPHAFLEEVVAQLEPGRALDLACGCGREAAFLAGCGWDVTAIDILPDALARGRDLARRYTPNSPPIRWLAADLERDPPAFECEFDLITGFRYLHRPLFARFADWLRPGGCVVWETFTTTHRARHGRPTRDEHVLQVGELPRLLAGFERVHASEEWRGPAHTARVWGRVAP